ncbi:hypothetical protein [Ascidiimonas aurantiaca]|uniref:hypothetical protein n=1 Tax=Ascidiimonas aurantiaca TaxID=1685432 RepID=UPI0030EDBF6F
MKKKLESQLVSIAHKILRLKGREDIIALQEEAKKVYEQLTILRFVEEHFGDLKPLVGKSEVISKFEELANKVMDSNKRVPENNPHEEDIIIPVMDTIKDMVAEMPREESLQDILSDILPEPTFVKRESQIITPDFTKRDTITETKTRSLNDTLNQSLNIGLNDRIAFVKHLFNESMEDYNRVISQLNTKQNLEEALTFINTMVKPDYNHWQNKDIYEERFLEIVQNKFS